VKKLALNSYAKLNLYLEVLNKRNDNYHNINTVFERIDLRDKIILRPRQDKLIRIICKNSSVPCDSSNLCYRSAKLLQDNFDVDKGLDIEIIKRIPVGSGLGGGSSNAAAVFLGLNKLWKLNLPKVKLAGLAGSVGCDIPFFIYGEAFAKGDNRGDRIKPLDKLKNLRLWHILIVPKIKVSTPLIYQKWDNFCGLTRPKVNVNILILALRKNGLFSLGSLLFNSLEEITLKLYPEVKRIKQKLASFGLKSILMTGSGPAVFGIVSSRKEAVSLRRRIKRENKSWRVFLTRTF